MSEINMIAFGKTSLRLKPVHVCPDSCFFFKLPTGFCQDISSFRNLPAKSGRFLAAYQWDGNAARQRLDGADECPCPKGVKNRVPSGRGFTHNNLKRVNLGDEEPNWYEFTYDYRGRRVEARYIDVEGGEEGPEVVWSERYVWDEWSLLLILDETDTIVRKFTWGLDIAEQANGLPRGGRPGAMAGGVGGLLAVEEVSGSHAGDYVYFYDGNPVSSGTGGHNVGQVLDWNAETVAAHYEYDPFGREIAPTGAYATTNRFRFSTKHLDPETDLYYYGFRYFSPDMGRWLNRDPINEVGHMMLREAKAFNLNEELNVYAMVRNNPVNLVDYIGLSSS